MLGEPHDAAVVPEVVVAQLREPVEPGTYVLTDYLATSFHRSVVVELGLDRFPELRDDYFGHYRRVVWLAQHPSARIRSAAERAADAIGLPLEEVVVGDALLEQALAALIQAS